MNNFFHLLINKFGLYKRNSVTFYHAEIIRSSSVWTLLLIFCCLVFTTFISYRSAKGLIEDSILVLHTQEVLEQVLEISTNIRAAEARQRGYLLTQEKIFLDNYQFSLQEVDSHLKTLKSLVTDNPRREKEVAELQQHIKNRSDAMEAVLNTYKNEGPDRGRQYLLESDGLHKMLQITQLIDIIKTEEKQLLKARSIESRLSRDYALKSLVIGGIFTTTLVLFSYYLMVNDLRRRKEIERSLANARDSLENKVLERTQELEQRNRELQEFAYVASHDLQEPLRKIQVFGDRLKQKAGNNLDESALDYLERMHSAAKRMQILINDLLQYSRVSAETKNENVVAVDFNRVIEEVLSDLEGSIELYNGHVSIDHLPIINGNPIQIRQLLQNILSNALKFHRADIPPEISVTWHNQTSPIEEETTSRFIEVAVTDNGIGIDPQYVDKIFVPFQRLHGKTEYEGTGIGLALCRKIIESHHGYIHVLPAASGNGTMFIIGFPIVL